MARRIGILLLLLLLGCLGGRAAFAQGYGGAVAYVLLTLLGPPIIGILLPRWPLRAALAFNLGAFSGVVWANVAFAMGHGIDLTRELPRDWPVIVVGLAWTITVALSAIPAAWITRR